MQVLSDAEKRGKYDRGEDVEPNQGNEGQGFNNFQNFFQNGGFTFRFGWKEKEKGREWGWLFYFYFF